MDMITIWHDMTRYTDTQHILKYYTQNNNDTVRSVVSLSQHNFTIEVPVFPSPQLNVEWIVAGRSLAIWWSLDVMS